MVVAQASMTSNLVFELGGIRQFRSAFFSFRMLVCGVKGGSPFVFHCYFLISGRKGLVLLHAILEFDMQWICILSEIKFEAARDLGP